MLKMMKTIKNVQLFFQKKFQESKKADFSTILVLKLSIKLKAYLS